MTKTLDPRYDPTDVEPRWRARWDASGLASPKPDSSAAPARTIVIPPPNVTGNLHMGHALNNTLQDVLIRYWRMCGFNTLWVPGTDHAGIATQWVVRRQLREEGIDLHDLGRKAFVERVWEWKAESGGMIVEQLKRLGVSCDWSRERFTMDEGLSQAVRETFVRLYEEGLIDRRKWLINWCTTCGTALSDLEVEHEDHNGHFWHIRYPLVDDESRFLVVATTRPETMLGDTAVAVHPDDERYADLVGKFVRLPLTGRTIPIIADAHADPEKGTGCVKITPGHDFNDFEVGRRHDLPMVNILEADGRLNTEAGRFAGLAVSEAREAVVAALSEEELLVSTETRAMSIGKCYRCATVAEPWLSLQWFLKMESLAEPALRAVEDGTITITPQLWVSTWKHWLENIHDWCISRQLWWGHRIPAWTCLDCNKVIVQREDPDQCVCGSSSLEQDPDVLDTWFSSQLWPFSTLGWPEDTPDLQTFYPTTTMVTGADILFFWVARMVMMGMHLMDDIPFRDIYLHSLVTDESGDKMSKTKGNVIDPLVMMDAYGTDAMRMALVAQLSEGKNIRVGHSIIEGYRNFMNKLWNASRFVLMNVEATDRKYTPDELKAVWASLDLGERWILGRLHQTVAAARSDLEGYRFGDFGMRCYHLVWSDFCDWYLEWSKSSIRDGDERVRRVLLTVLETLTRLMHPVIPFATEEIRSALPGEHGLAMGAAFPVAEDLPFDEDAMDRAQQIMDTVSAIRRARSELRLPPKARPAAVAVGEDGIVNSLLEQEDALLFLAGLGSITKGGAPGAEQLAVQAPVSGLTVWLMLDGILDVGAEKARIEKEIKKTEKELDRVQKKLSNVNFVERAPADVIEKQRAIAADLEDLLDRQRNGAQRLAALGGGDS